MTIPEQEKPINFEELGAALGAAGVGYRAVMIACGCSPPVANAVLNGVWSPENPRHSMVMGLIQLAQKHDIPIPTKD